MAYKNLNKEQLEAAKAPFGNNLVIASAGTGKTSTIVARIYYLLENGVRPEDILLLTFTNKAAKKGFTIKDHAMQIYGTCKECNQKAKGKDS